MNYKTTTSTMGVQMKQIKMITMIILIATMSIIAQIPTNGLVAYYPFNGNYQDESGNGNDLEIAAAGSPTLIADRFGNANSAYNFDGNLQSFKGTQKKLPLGNTNLTISAWYTRTVAGTPRIIVSWGKMEKGVNSEISLFHTSKEGLMHIGITNGIDSIITNARYMGAPDTSHIVVAINNSEAKLYIDGKLLTSKAFPVNISSDGFLGIGAIWGNPYSDLCNHGGALDDIAIYNRALSEDEVTYLHNCNSALNATPKIISIPITIAKSGNHYSYNISVDDDQNTTLKLLNAPSGMSLNNNTLEWSPTNDDAGAHSVSIIATDELNSTDTQTYELIVEPTTRISKSVIHQRLQINNKFVVRYLPNGQIYRGDNISGLLVGRGYQKIILR